MLDQCHLGDQIGHLDQLGLGVAAGDDHVLVGGLLVAQEGQDFIEIEIVVTQHDVQLVEQHQPMTVIADHLLGALPARGRGGDVTLTVLGDPGEALAHDVQRDQIRKGLQQTRFARVPFRRLGELHDADGIAMTDMAEHHAQRRRCLALAGAGMDDQQAFLSDLGRHDLVLRRLVFGGLDLVAGIFFIVVDSFGHAISFAISLCACGRSSAIRSAARLERGVHKPRRMASAKRAAVSRNAAGFADVMKPRTSSSSR